VPQYAVNCKICNNSFTANKPNASLCSLACKRVNRQIHSNKANKDQKTFRNKTGKVSSYMLYDETPYTNDEALTVLAQHISQQQR
jgi:hypothetical protein